MKKILSDTELMIMRFIWGRAEESVTATEIREYFEKHGKNWKKQTVSTYLKKLVNQGYLKLTVTNGHYFYSPLITAAEHTDACNKIITKLLKKDTGGVYCTLLRPKLPTDEKPEVKPDLLNDLEN